MDCTEINPYDNERAKGAQVKEMFDSIAPAYDFMNRAMTFGIDKWWRRRAVARLASHPHDRILDIATGTGDLAILMARRLDPVSVTGVDLSEGMIEIGRRKIKDEGLTDVVSLQPGDCLNLPFTDRSFDCVTAAYGVRNFENLLAGYREMFRVLIPGGTVCIIELSTPTSPIIRPLYNLYSRHIIPAVGRMVSKDTRAYSYLPESIAAVPQGDAMLAIMREAGFTDTTFHPMTFGTCTVYMATKPTV